MSKSGYSIYSLSVFNFKKLMLKMGMKHLKKMGVPELACEIFSSPYSSNLDKHQLVSEVLWEHFGRNVVFPSDENFFNTLLKSNFALGQSASLSLPFSSFILAMPKNFVVDGVKIPSVLVNYNKSANRSARYELATKLMGLTPMPHDDSGLEGQDSLSFFYQDPYEEKGVTVQTTQTPLTVASALKSSTAQEYSDILGQMPKELVSPIAVDLSDSDKVIQFVITKILAGISVYMSANGLDGLIDGLPAGGRASVFNLKKGVRYAFSHIPAPSTVGELAGSDVMTTRAFHFRQLRAPVYYQNEYAHMEPGTRWVFVREAQVGKFKASHIQPSFESQP